jgi:hypothetical protein
VSQYLHKSEKSRNDSPEELSKLIFNGEEFTQFPTSWKFDGDVLNSGTGDLLDKWAIFEATGGGTLTARALRRSTILHSSPGRI